MFNSYSSLAFVVYSELIKAYSNTKHVIIDGKIHGNHKIIKGLELVLDEMPQIDFIPKADSSIPLVNIADCIANKLFRYHTSCAKGGKCNRYFNHLITPDIKKYTPILKNLF